MPAAHPDILNPRRIDAEARALGFDGGFGIWGLGFRDGYDGIARLAFPGERPARVYMAAYTEGRRIAALDEESGILDDMIDAARSADSLICA